MNFLAHVYIAEQRGAELAGAVLGDVVRGRDLDHLPAGLAHSIQLHRRVDARFDCHPVTRAALQRIPSGPRRFAGIMLDLCADHLLARHWAEWHPQPLPEFCAATARAIADDHSAFAALQRPPPDAVRFAAVLESVQFESGIERARRRISERARHPQRLLDATRDWPSYIGLLEAGFPDLLRDCLRA